MKFLYPKAPLILFKRKQKYLLCIGKNLCQENLFLILTCKAFSFDLLGLNMFNPRCLIRLRAKLRSDYQMLFGK
jgi:hypothetical protein